MTSNELKHKAKKQEWNIAIQECRGSGLSVSEWCRQQGVTTTLLASFSGIPLSFAEAQILPSKENMRKNESSLIRKKLKETILKMTPYQQDLMLVAVEKME